MISNIRYRAQGNSFTKNTFQDLRSPGLFAKLPILGITMFLFGSLIFGILAYSLRTDALLQWDMTTAKMFREVQISAPWSSMENILFGIFVGKEVVILIGTILAIYFLHKHFWCELMMELTSLGGGVLIWVVLSRYFDRPPPTDHLEVLQGLGSSFPSGPALLSLVGYGLLAYLLVPNLTSRFWKWFVALLCILAIGTVALSSLLFGTHYASDVIVGYSLGIAWAGLVGTLVEIIFRERTIAKQEHLQTETAFQGLRAPGLFKKRPMIGFGLILLGSLSFAALGYGLLTNGPLVQLDISLYKELLATAKAAPPSVNDMMLFGFFLGKQAVQLTVLILSIYFLYQRYWLELAMIQISMQGGGFLKNFVIDYFARPRPPEQLGLVIPTLPSFPSGHAMGTIICYGFLAYLLVSKMPSPFWKWTLSVITLLLVLFEGFSRIFHGNHYLTDVLAGYTLGMTWLILVCMLLERIFMRSRGKLELQIPE
jgi:membrane-associated phospholipid phosphatase